MSPNQSKLFSRAQRTENKTASKVKVTGIRSLRKILASRDLRRLVPIIVMTSLMTNLLALALPLGMLQIFDRVLKNQSVDTLVVLTLGIVLMMVLEEVLKGVNATVTNWLGARFKHKASMQVLNKFFEIPMRLFSKEEPGAYAEKIQTVSKVADVYSGSALLVLLDLPFVLIFLSVIWLIADSLVIVPILLIIFFVVSVLFFGRWMYKQIIMRDLNDERRISFLTEVLAGVLSIKTMSLESIMQRRYERLKENSAEQGERLFFGNNFANNLGSIMSQIMIVLVIFFGAMLVLGGDMSSGALAACMMLSVRALQPLQKGLSIWMRYQAFIAGDKRLTDVLSMPGHHEHGLSPLMNVHRGLRLDHVSLGHDTAEGKKYLFKDLCLDIPKGQCIAIRGDSGSGKTALLSLINGIEELDEGAVLVDGESIKQFQSESVRQKIALLPQEGVVFVGSILENLTMFDPSRETRALEVSEQIGLDLIVASMKQGYQTPLGENASETLPMGVRQLIAIVRVLAFDPAVILFDEANSALDFEGDKKLRQYLEARKGELTMVMVTNRPSMVKLADTIYRIHNGTLELDDGKFDFSRKGQDDAGFVKPEKDDSLETVIGTRVFNESDLSRCLLPLARHLGWGGSIREFAQALPHLADHIDLSYFFGAMANMGFRARYLGNKFKKLDDRLLPCIFMPNNKPAVAVLELLPEGGYRVFNSQSNSEEVWQKLPSDKGEIFIFQPIKPEDERSKLTWVKELFWKFRKHLSLIFVITIISTILAVAPSLFVRSVFDTVIPSGDIVMGGFLLMGVVLAISIGWFLNLLRGKLLAYIGGRIEYVLGNSIFERVLHLPVSSLNGVSVSRQISRIKSLERLRDLFLGPLVTLIFDLPSSIILLVVIFVINPWAAGVMLIAIAAFALLLILTRPIVDRAAENASESSGKKSELIDESLGKMGGLRTLGSQSVWMRRFRDISGSSAHTEFTEQQTQHKISAVSHLIGSLTGLSILVTSAYMVIQAAITPGTIMATMILTWRLISPLQNLFTALTSWSRISTNIFQVNQLMKLAQENDGHNPEANRFVNKGAIDFNRVSFRYASDLDPVLLGVTFKVPSAKLLGITGPDGAGKSTLLSLICRLHYPQAGSIRIDAIDTRQISSDYLRSIISYMPQKCDIFYGTLAQNLRLVHPAATEDELWWAIKMAGLDGDVERMEKGINTRVSNSSTDQMSSGFRQRLSLARTILKPASIVLLDEPGNGMDDAGEEALMRCINWLQGRVTLILVTPRPSHLRGADHILYMENGTITARGNYAEVEEKIMAGLS
ncbi:peptidase domain-containing ABC transporter [Oceanospirillum maris]|uniref:peptidase domain-containing ABC transporter n=1 Tax=Oceanospirillum maris TaxID=64977 RepID=UPI00040073AC|nr:ATP-binding cassette domain-containing protein [Oceanospirillum maris]